MGWLASFRLNGKAKRYARRLPIALFRGWGVSAFFTPGQIRAAAKTARLDPRYIALGYAGFLPREEYNSAVAALSIKLDYDDARTRLVKFTPGGTRTSAGDGVGLDYSQYVGSIESGGVGQIGGGHHGH